jgi:hypothetical protein
MMSSSLLWMKETTLKFRQDARDLTGIPDETQWKNLDDTIDQFLRKRLLVNDEGFNTYWNGVESKRFTDSPLIEQPRRVSHHAIPTSTQS